jgi:hypothetical protein
MVTTDESRAFLMNNPTVSSENTASTATPSSVPAPIRLVHAFRDAVRASMTESDLSEEAAELEALVIAGNASFEALTRFDDFLREIASEGGNSGPFDRWAVVLASETWLDAAESLRGRLSNLEREGYESDSFTAFSNAKGKAFATYSEGWARKGLERQALHTGDLAALAAKLKPRQDVYDEEEG